MHRRFTETRLGELRMLNQNTFFAVSEISDDFKTPSACHFIYGDCEYLCLSFRLHIIYHSFDALTLRLLLFSSSPLPSTPAVNATEDAVETEGLTHEAFEQVRLHRLFLRPMSYVLCHKSSFCDADMQYADMQICSR
jgi:hypothetical protein